MTTNDIYRTEETNRISIAGPKQEIYQELVRQATEIFRTRPSWAEYFKKILSKEGLVRQALITAEAIQIFEQTEEFAEIQRMLKILRQRKREPNAPDAEETKVITVRLPASMHEWLIEEAKESNTSMNRLCITKLLQVISEQENK